MRFYLRFRLLLGLGLLFFAHHDLVPQIGIDIIGLLTGSGANLDAVDFDFISNQVGSVPYLAMVIDLLGN